jgi:hypothetical protein
LKEKTGGWANPVSAEAIPIILLLREEGQPPLTPTRKDPCLRLFPGNDFVWILTIFFKTPVEFAQLVLGDGHFVGTGR